jgi:hypothetical protein
MASLMGVRKILIRQHINRTRYMVEEWRLLGCYAVWLL